MAEERLISLSEAASRFGLSHAHLRLLARTAKIKAEKVGHYWLTTEEAVAAYLKQQQTRGKKRGRKPKG